MISPFDQSSNVDGQNVNESEEVSHKWRLYYLLRVEALFGITYCGNTPMGKRSDLRRIWMIAYDILLTVLFFASYYMAFSNDSFNRIFKGEKDAPNRGVLNLVFRVSGFANVAEYVVIKIMLIINGRQIFSTIESIGHVSNKRHMHFIWFYMFCTSVINSVALTINFVDLDQTFVEFYNKEKVKAFIFLWAGLNQSMVKSSLLMLLIYSSFVVQRQLNGIANNFQNNLVKKPMKLCQTIIDLRTKIGVINSLVGIIMLVKIVTNSIEISGCICAVAVGKLDLTSTLGISAFLFTALCDIFVSNHSSQLIICAFNNLSAVIENSMSIHSFTDEDYRQLKVIVSMKDSFRYQVLNLFDLRDLTILSIIGYIANYSVILIQTQ